MRLFLTLAICFAFPFSLFSSIYTFQKDIEVGKQPLKVIFDEGTGIHVFCDRYDSNYNGEFEPELGETKSSWWLIPYMQSDTAILLKEFDWDFTFGFSIGYPLRPALNNGVIYFHTNNGVMPYRLDNAELVESEIVPIPCNAVSIFEDKMYLSVRHIPEGGWVADTNYVIVYDITSKTVIDTLPAIANVQQTLCVQRYYPNKEKYLLVLNEGFMGAGDSKLQVFKINDDSFDLENIIDLGDTGNHIFFNKNDEIFITMNGSHTVQVISVEDFSIKETINLPTSDFDGPREVGAVLAIPLKARKEEPTTLSDLSTPLIFISSYSGKVFVYHRGILEDSIDTKGKSEGIYVDPSGAGFWVANLFQEGTYSPDNRISFYSLNLSVGGKESDNSLFAVYPNPASNAINISSEKDEVENIELISLQGKTVFQKQVNKETAYKISLEALNLPNGLYFVKITNANSISSFPVLIKSE